MMMTRSNGVLATICFLIVGVVAIGGCATDPRQRFIDADRRLGIAADAAKAAFDSHLLDDKPDVIKTIQFSLREANAFQIKAKPLAEQGASPALDDYLDQIEAATARVLAALAAKDHK